MNDQDSGTRGWVFVSYARTDSTMATSVVDLLRARDDVFYDVDSIPAGRRWREGLLRGIERASHFYLLWCAHSANSSEVRDEYELAIARDKRLVPVLLDSTPLVGPLDQYQWVDFRTVLGRGHGSVPARRGVISSIAAVLILAVAILAFLTLRAGDRDPVDSCPQPPCDGTAAIGSPLLGVALLLLLGAVFALVAWGRRYLTKRTARRAAAPVAEGIAEHLLRFDASS